MMQTTLRSATTRIIGAALAILVVLATVLVGTSSASAEGPSQLTLTKTASTATIAPGETFTYQLEVGCSALDIGTGCTNATLVDPIPSDFDIVGVTVGTGLSAETPTTTNNTVTVVFNSPLADPPGSIGLLAAATGVVIITVRAHDPLPFEENGVPIDNTGTLTATNAVAPATSTATVTPTIPLNLATTATKSFTPDSATAVPGDSTTLTVGATNTSNSGVDSITLQDPTDPTATPNPFDLLEVTGTGAITFPTGADQVEVDVWDGTEWVTGTPGPTAVLPPSVAETDIHGIRLIFTNSAGTPIPAGASASVDVDLVQRPDVADLTSTTTVANQVQSTVDLGAQSATGTANGTFTILAQNVTVGATKSFSPDTVVVGDPTTVTLGASNDSAVPLTELQITEPTQPGINPFAAGFPAGTAFAGFAPGVTWPAGATSASVHYYYSDLTQETIDATGPNTLPPPDPSKTVVRFTVTFEGDMPPGQSASVPFVLNTDPSLTNDSTVVTNSETVTGTTGIGTTGSADATADLTVYTTRLAVEVGKSISPNEIAASAGEFVTVSLPSSLAPFPQTTTDANTIVVQDPPGDPPALTDWWNHFNATDITQTAVPAGATMSIEYWDGTQWLPLPVVNATDGGSFATEIVGPTLYSAQIDPSVVDDIQGLRFTFASDTGFPQGTTVQPNVTMSLRSQLRDGSGPATGTAATVENCASASATGDALTANAEVPAPCPAVTLVPGGIGGGDDFLDKTWVGPKVVTARTESEVPVQLNWSTGGRANLGSMVISDESDPTTTSVANSVYNAFNLVAVPAISAAQDPFLKYDEVASVQLFNGTDWVDATNDPCPFACIGTFPGVTITAAEQLSTVGVRLTYVESPDRAAASVGDLNAPPVGSGVTRSSGNTRQITLTFQLRDDVRAPNTTPDPVVGTRIYNTGTAGEVNNTARATGTSTVDNSVVTDTASDIIRLLDVPLNVQVNKTWAGGPLGIPPAGTDPTLYPSGQVSITATNTTAANVDQLDVMDPATPGASLPFNDFDLTRIDSISIPAGATSTEVILTTSAGGVISVTPIQALTLTATALANVVSIQVIHTGRIEAGADTTVTFETRLRATHRDDGATITAAADSPVANVAEGGVGDEGGAPGGNPTATSGATIDLQNGDISVTATKSFSPASQTEPDDSPVTMTLTGQPGGSIRSTSLTLTDDTGTFWNAFDYAGLASPISLAFPIDQVQTDACVGRSFADPTLDCVASGGHWVLGTPTTGTASTLPAGVTNDQVEGLRYTFTRADGGLFQSANPIIQTVNDSVQRRTDLRSGGPVPSDISTDSPAPGETAAGTFTNTMDADVVGAFTVGGAPFTASDSSTATEHYVHLNSAVSVTKSPAGVQQPGTIIPYTLTVTNTGQIAVTDPVITDYIPSDADGPMLVFDPFADPTGPGPYTYALSGAAPSPASGPAMPTTPADVSAVVGTGGTQIQFSFPPGTVLEVGQTYTITIALQFRTGLTAETQVTNTFGVVGDRPFDTCGGTTDPATGECDASTTVTVQTAGALRGIKYVRAVDTSLGVDNTVPSIPCAPNADNFYSAQCVPITRPGGNEIWRLSLLNTGTLPMDRMIAVDKLPTPGDTGAIANLPRGSQFRPTYTGTSVLANAPAGTVMTEYYTTDASPCVDDLATTGVACPAGAWTLWDGTADPTTVTGLKFVVDFPTPIQPAQGIDIDVTTRTPGSAPDGGVDPIAWNTVAVAGRFELNGTENVTAQTEGNKVGVALATGPLSFEKVITGAGAAFAPDSFTGTVQCESAGETVPERPITLTPGTPTTIDDLPLGASCTVAENDSGQTSWSAPPAIVGESTDPVGVVTVTNEYDLAGLVVTKTVSTTAVDQDGNPIAYGPFPVTVDCLFLDAPVYATGYSATSPMTAELSAGQSLRLVGLPAGAECTVTETDAKGATSTTVATTTSASSIPATAGTSSVVDLTPDVVGRSTNSVALVNTFDSGSLELLKTVQGPGAADFGAGPFVFSVTCTLDDASGSRTVWDGTITLGGAFPLNHTIDGIATGAVCTVIETSSGGATLTQQPSPNPVTIGAGSTVSVSATNTFLAGSLRVIKERVGPGADLYGAGPFQVTLTCLASIDGRPTLVSIPGGATRMMDASNDYTATYDILPAGAACLPRETMTGGATTAVMTDGLGRSAEATPVVADGVITFTDVNTYDVGSIRVTKSVVGTPPAGATYTVHLTCSLVENSDAVAIDIPGGADRTLSADTSLTTVYEDLPTGAGCFLSETGFGGANSVSITPNEGDDQNGIVTVGDDEVVDISVVNTFDSAPAGLAVTGTNVTTLLLLAITALLGGAVLMGIRRRPFRG